MSNSSDAGIGTAANAEALALARACGEKMLANDQVAAGYGIVLDSITPDRAVLKMKVRPDMLNLVGNCHGGVTYTLADVAFATASVATNVSGVGVHLATDYVGVGREGEELTAVATVRQRGRSANLIDIDVSNEKGRVIVQVRGRTHNLSAPFLEE